MNRITFSNKRRLAWRVALLGSVVLLTACGSGGGNEPPASPGAATVGVAGGTVLAGDGAQVVFPKDALRSDTTVRIAKDSTGAPPLPAGATPAGAVFSITPHGEAFAAHAEVSIPVEMTQIEDNQQLLLVTAEPGDTQWRVLSGATYSNGVLRAPVMHFSFFQAIVLTNLSMPSLVTTIGGGRSEFGTRVSNNVGGAGIGRLAPDFEFNQDSWLQYSQAYLQAKLTFPASPLAVRSGLPQPPPPQACMPTSLGHTGAAWRFLRNGTQAQSPDVDHTPIVQGAESSYPRFENEISFGGWSSLYTGDAVSGFGAVHVYGQDAPRRGAFAPAGSTDVWALPPAGNSADNDLLMWSGFVFFEGEKHNGRMRIETTIATDCNLLIEAVPISFQLNLASRIPAWQPYTGVQALDSPINVPNGLTAVLPFAEEFDGTSLSIAWEYSHDAVNWEKLPVPAQYIRNDGLATSFFDRFLYGHYYSIVIPNVQPTQAGWYRAWACSKPIAADPPAAALPSICVSKAPVQLVVLTERPTVTTQPGPQIVQVGQTASFTVRTGGLPGAGVQWQKRPLGEAAFGIGTWTTIDGATFSTYTTPPTTLNDTATLYRAVATTVLGSTPSDAALLTVVEQLAPPVVQSQPGNLNVTVGGSAMFAATVSGTAPLSYQWRRNGANRIGANSAILTLANVSALDAGRYDLVVSNRAGGVTSEPAALVVTEGTPVALAPTIAAAPASITVAEGNAANFAVSVNGTGPYTYLWMKNGVQAPIPGGDLPSFGIASVSTTDAGTYSVRVTNNIGTVVSAAATLTVSAGTATPVVPSISTQPATLVVMPGSAATLAIAASGSGPLLYQWSRNGTPVNGATGAVLHLTSVSTLDVGTYTVAVSNGAGSVGSSAAQLILLGAPSITTQPSNASVFEGAAATLSVAATGDALLYQWLRNGVSIGGASSASYTTAALAPGDSGAVYSVIVYNGAGLVFSQGAVLTVSPLVAPSFSTQPADQGVVEPAVATFTAVVGGSPTPTLQWQLSSDGGSNWVDIAGATSASYTTPATGVADSGRQYRVVATNSAGPVASAAATLTVTLATPPLSAPLSAGKIAVGPFHTCAVKADATAACWGHGSSGEALPGSTSDQWTPQVIPGLSGVTYVAAGQVESCAIDGTGTLWCWGGGRGLAAIQDGSGVNYTGVKAVATGFLHQCFIDAGTTVRCWGNNSLGQLGADPALTGSGFVATPVFVNRLNSVPLTGVVSLAADGDGNNTCALTSAGEVVCWGNGNFVALPVVTGATAMRAGSGHACAVMAAGGMKCWGANGNGQLGNRSTTASPVPVSVIDLPGLLNGVTVIATQSTNTCVIPATGRVVCWGAVDPDRLNGINTFGPTEKGNLAQRVVALSSGRAQTCALVVDGSIECWGSNQFGQLGLGHFNAINSGGPFPPTTSVVGGATFWH